MVGLEVVSCLSKTMSIALVYLQLSETSRNNRTRRHYQTVHRMEKSPRSMYHCSPVCAPLFKKTVSIPGKSNLRYFLGSSRRFIGEAGRSYEAWHDPPESR